MCVSEEFIRLLFGDLLDVSSIKERKRGPDDHREYRQAGRIGQSRDARTSAGSAPCMNIVSLAATRPDAAIPETLAV